VEPFTIKDILEVREVAKSKAGGTEVARPGLLCRGRRNTKLVLPQVLLLALFLS
jgi:hypothetical protein